MLTQAQLSNRWEVPERTLETWRYQGRGPAFVHIGKTVRYPLADVEAYEAANRTEAA